MAKQYNVSVLVELFDKLTTPLTAMNKKIVETGQRMSEVGKKLTFGVSLPILGIGVAAVKTSADIEKYTQSFTTMLKSADAGKKFVKDLRDFAAKTPLEFADLAKNAELMLAFNIQSKDVLPTMQMLGDVARGDAEKLSQLSLAYSQMYSTGRLMGQDLLQMINAGFNPLVIISEKTGKSMAQLKDEMSKGQISVEMVTDAFKSATSAGGLFYKAMETQSKTFYGRLSTLKDNFVLFLSKLGDALFPLVNSMLDGLAGIVDWMNNLGEGTTQLIVLFGGLAAAVGPVMFGFGKLMQFFGGGITPLHLIIGGLTLLAGGIIAVSAAIDQNNKRFITAADNAKKESETVSSLVSEYEMLKSKTSLNTTEKIKLIEVENKLKVLLPETALVFDEQAKMIGINTKAVKEHLAELKRIEKINLADEIKRLDGLINQSEKRISAARTRQKQTAQSYDIKNLSKADIAMFGEEYARADQLERKKKANKEIDDELAKLITEQLKLIEQKAEIEARLAEAEGKNTKTQTDLIDKQNKSLGKNLSFREKLLMLQRKFDESGGFAVRHTRNLTDSVAALSQQASKTKAEVTIKVKADNGSSVTVEKVSKQSGNMDVNIITDSYLGYTVPVGN